MVVWIGMTSIAELRLRAGRLVARHGLVGALPCLAVRRSTKAAPLPFSIFAGSRELFAGSHFDATKCCVPFSGFEATRKILTSRFDHRYGRTDVRAPRRDVCCL